MELISFVNNFLEQVQVPSIRYNLADLPERMMFVYQIAAGMCLIGELCAQGLPKVKPNAKVVPMGAVAVARLRFYFDFLGHVILLCPQLFYFGLPNQQKPPLLDRCFMVLSIVLLSADKKPLLKGFLVFVFEGQFFFSVLKKFFLLFQAALTVFLRLANETRQQFQPVVANVLGEKLPSLLPPIFYIVLKIVNGDIEDDVDSKSTILGLSAQVMLDTSRNFHPVFVNGIAGAMQQMLDRPPNQQWVQQFAECKDPLQFRQRIIEFIKSFFS